MVTYTDEIRMSGPIPEFGIKQDDTLQSALEKMASAFMEKIQIIDKEIFPVSPEVTTESIKHIGDIINGTELASDAKALEGSTVKVEFARQTEDVQLTFKATDFPIPEGSVIRSSRVNISGERYMGRNEIANTDQPEMVVSIGYNRFPITVDARVVVNTPTGEVELKKVLRYESAKDLAQETPYEVIDRTTQAKPTNLKEVLKQFDSRIKSVENFKKVSG